VARAEVLDERSRARRTALGKKRAGIGACTDGYRYGHSQPFDPGATCIHCPV